MTDSKTRRAFALIAMTGLLSLGGCGESVPPAEEIKVSDSGPIESIPEASFGPEDWPWWRGPMRNGVAVTTEAPTSWSDGENVVWKVSIPGHGHSSPTVVGDRIFMATADDSAEVQSILCFSRGTGQQLWKKDVYSGEFPARDQMHPNSTHATCTLACDGERVFGAFLNHKKIHAVALNLEGEVVWDVELGPFNSKFGYAPSPMIHKELVLFSADHRDGGFLAGVHRKNGTIHWRTLREKAGSYSSAVVANVSGKDQLLISGINKVCSYDPMTGEQNWSAEGTTDATCGTMVWDADNVYASGGYPGSQTLSVAGDGSATVNWTTNKHAYEPSMLLTDGYLYAVVKGGIAICWDAATGKEAWKGRLKGKFSSSPILVGENIYATNESGTTFVFRATPDGFESVAENKLGDECFATASACGGKLYFRVAKMDGDTRQEYLYCIGQ